MQSKLIISAKYGQFVVKDTKEKLMALKHVWVEFNSKQGVDCERVIEFTFVEPKLEAAALLNHSITLKCEDVVNMLYVEESDLDLSASNISSIKKNPFVN